MATRKDHLAKAGELLAEAGSMYTSPERAKIARAQAEAHTSLAEAMRPTRPTRPVFGASRISRGRR